MERCFLLILLSVPGFLSDSIKPKDKETNIYRNEEERVTLSCSYDASSSYVYLYWYRQYPNKEPEYLLWKGFLSDSIKPKDKETNIYRNEEERVTLSCSYDSSSNSILLYWYRQNPNKEPEYLLWKGARSWDGDEDIPDPQRFQSTTSQTSTELIINSGTLGNLITPDHNEMLRPEGANITLSCNYSSSAYSLQWYRQYPGQASKYLFVIQYATRKVTQISEIVSLDPRFSAKLNEKKTHMYLEISPAEVTDSAIYYCAMEPTVTGNTRTLYKNPLNSNTLGVICQDRIGPSGERTSVISTEGDSVTLECSYDSSSSYVLLYWYRQFTNTQPQFVLAKGGSFANITPVQTKVYEKEGEIVTLSCNYSSASTLQWYRQYPGSAPEFLLAISPYSGKVSQKSEIVDQDPRFSGKVNELKTHVYLNISTAKVTDSAIYYCTLEPTVTGNTRTLYKNPLNSNTVGVICQERIGPSGERTSVISTEGDSVTLECSYDSSSSYVLLYWYRQFTNTQPQFVLAKGGRSETYKNIPDPRFESTTSQTSTSLTINSVTLSDSALYYCALRVAAAAQ
ncbi:T-cell receptor alpha chain V region CTL-L17 [Anabarilius grahami]|nr:T-cell receptor alpha chain V region CTL-L17 [Anabarilius grahami]